MSDAKDHTIILAQFTSSPESKQYRDYERLSEAMDGVCQMYEYRLKQISPDKTKIVYDIKDLFEFIESLPDISALVYKPSAFAYVPHDREWIKNKVLAHLKAMQAASN